MGNSSGKSSSSRALDHELRRLPMTMMKVIFTLIQAAFDERENKARNSDVVLQSASA
jgi:hypothetical protein